MNSTFEPHDSTPSLAWYDHVWLALPFALVAVGGLIGGACGGAAWAINQHVFKKIDNVLLRYVITGVISVAAVVVYIILAAVVFVALGGPARP